MYICSCSILVRNKNLFEMHCVNIFNTPSQVAFWRAKKALLGILKIVELIHFTNYGLN